MSSRVGPPQLGHLSPEPDTARAAENDGGPSTGGCSAGEFPPTAGLVVTRSSPDELRERFPIGTALQFVAEGSEVHIYAKAPPLTERTP